MLVSFFVASALYAAVSFIVFAVTAMFNQVNAERLSMLYLEWLFVSFFIFALIMFYILWSTPDA